VPLGRRFRALKLWFVLRTYGRAGLQAYLRHHLALAAGVEARVRADSRFELAAPPRFALVCFRLKARRPPVVKDSAVHSSLHMNEPVQTAWSDASEACGARPKFPGKE
jgi:glutamate/tyrosine decarboxylase-like PLP-dependent enzyme